jgi:hypothetical protein
MAAAAPVMPTSPRHAVVPPSPAPNGGRATVGIGPGSEDSKETSSHRGPRAAAAMMPSPGGVPEWVPSLGGTPAACIPSVDGVLRDHLRLRFGYSAIWMLTANAAEIGPVRR